MVGLFLAALWFALAALLLRQPLGGYRDAVKFLLCWYTVSGALIVGLASLTNFLWARKIETPLDRLPLMKILSFLSGLELGRHLSLGIFILTFKTFFLVGGATFLLRAADGANDLSQLDVPSLIVGVIILTATCFVGMRLKPIPSSDR